MSALVPTDVVATTSTMYRPGCAWRLPIRPRHVTCCAPAARCPELTVATGTPFGRSIRTTTFAGRVSWKVAIGNPREPRLTPREASVSSRENVRVAVVVTERSSVAVTENVHWPSGAGAVPFVPSHVKVYKPEACAAFARVIFVLPGPDSVATTVEGRAIR